MVDAPHTMHSRVLKYQIYRGEATHTSYPGASSSYTERTLSDTPYGVSTS